MVTKDTTKSARKAVAKKVAPKAAPKAEVEEEKPVAAKKVEAKAPKATGRYMYATGRRKTAVANVRLFAGAGDSLVNKKALEVYFSQSALSENILRPLALTGLVGEYHFIASVNGGGTNAQSDAVRHGISQALATLNDDLRKILKKNGFLTRDDRKKERKKPGLRGARRAPQWAKR
jgi:small subunit ribosomal protein S9